ncbi:hypothetical protein PMAYCL1PPCAC_00118, partial [Pristionchus mayeri]
YTRESQLFDNWGDARSDLLNNYVPVTVENTNQTNAASILRDTKDSASLLFVVPQTEAYSDRVAAEKDSLDTGNMMSSLVEQKVLFFAPTMEQSD